MKLVRPAIVRVVYGREPVVHYVVDTWPICREADVRPNPACSFVHRPVTCKQCLSKVAQYQNKPEYLIATVGR